MMGVQIVAACCESLREDAAHLAMILASSEADRHTYNTPIWTNPSGQTFRLAGWRAGETWLASASSGQLLRPAWDENSVINMDAAFRVYEKTLVLFNTGQEPQQAQFGKLVVLVGWEIPEALAALNVTMVMAE